MAEYFFAPELELIGEGVDLVATLEAMGYEVNIVNLGGDEWWQNRKIEDISVPPADDDGRDLKAVFDSEDGPCALYLKPVGGLALQVTELQARLISDEAENVAIRDGVARGMAEAMSGNIRPIQELWGDDAYGSIEVDAPKIRRPITEIEKEPLHVLAKRILHLEGKLEDAMGIILKYARPTWVAEAKELFVDVTGDEDFSSECASVAWDSELGKQTKEFGYPIPPCSADESVQIELSYWTG